MSLRKEDMRWSKYHNIGLQHPEFTRLAEPFSEELFSRFRTFVQNKLERCLSLLVSHGCSLNRGYFGAWSTFGLLEGVFVPLCTKDTLAAVGTSVDAMWTLTGKDVYCGQDFIDDKPEMPDVKSAPLDLPTWLAARRPAA
jgi:predicted NodU family carbamoyl transferase